MNHHTKACLLGAIVGLAVLMPGCGEDNEKTAKIEGGTLPTDSLTPQQRREKATGIAGDAGKNAGYPGTGGTPASGAAPSGTGNNRKN